VENWCHNQPANTVGNVLSSTIKIFCIYNIHVYSLQTIIIPMSRSQEVKLCVVNHCLNDFDVGSGTGLFRKDYYIPFSTHNAHLLKFSVQLTFEKEFIKILGGCFFYETRCTYPHYQQATLHQGSSAELRLRTPSIAFPLWPGHFRVDGLTDYSNVIQSSICSR